MELQTPAVCLNIFVCIYVCMRPYSETPKKHPVLQTHTIQKVLGQGSNGWGSMQQSYEGLAGLCFRCLLLDTLAGTTLSGSG